MNSIKLHEFPQGDLGCKITVEENINTGALSSPAIYWNAGKSPTEAEETEAAARAARTQDSVYYQRRGYAYDRLRAEFSSYNKARVVAQECTPAEMNTWLDTEESQGVFASMRTLNFSAAITKINAMVDPLATTEFKSFWTAKLTAEL